MTTRLSKTVTGVVAAATVALSAAALSTPAEAHWHGGWGYGALGFGLGLGVGAIIASQPAPVYTCRLVNTYDRYGHFLGAVRRC